MTSEDLPVCRAGEIHAGNSKPRAARRRPQTRPKKTRRDSAIDKPSLLPASGEREFALGTAQAFGIFRGVCTQKILAVMRHCQVGLLPRATGWIAEGDHSPGVVFVESGLIKLVLHGSGGTDRLFRLVMPGEIFGVEVSLLSCECRYDVIAAIDSRVFVLPSAEICSLLRSDLRFARNLAEALAKTVDDLLMEHASSTLFPALQRLAAYLDHLAKRYPLRAKRVITLPVQKNVLAARLGVRKETFSRLWRALAVHNIIAASKDEITVLEPERLAQIAAGIGLLRIPPPTVRTGPRGLHVR